MISSLLCPKARSVPDKAPAANDTPAVAKNLVRVESLDRCKGRAPAATLFAPIFFWCVNLDIIWCDGATRICSRLRDECPIDLRTLNCLSNKISNRRCFLAALNDGRDMVQPQSSILKRKRGNATLTIFVKPENGGSEVKMFSEGLSWDRQ